MRLRRFNNWSLRYKLLVVLLQLGITTFAVTGGIAYIKHLQSLKQGVVNQLTGVRRAKAYEIESYYRTIRNHVMTLSDDRMFIDAMRDFSAAYRALDATPVSAQERQAVSDDYRVRFYPQMQVLKIARPHLEEYLPVVPAAWHLQFAYIARNPFPDNPRDMLRTADGSDYSRVHALYHPAFKKLVEAFGYYDLYLVDSETGTAVYAVNKDRDFGTSLKLGPYRDSNLAKVVRQCLGTDDPDGVFFSDFEPYEANRGEPTQWVASPIFDGPQRVGVLALQISATHLDDVVTGHRGWRRDGLGQTGRSNIVGPKYWIRNNARGFLEDRAAFLRQLQAQGASPDQLTRIRLHDSTILELQIRRPSVMAALAGKEGWAIEPSPFGPRKAWCRSCR
jgi:hypothetical protein